MSVHQGLSVGVFGSDRESKSAFVTSVGKKSEAEGIIVYHRTDGGRRVSLLDTTDFPERIQGYSRIASIADHALFIVPKSGKLSASDGEIVVLTDAFGIKGTLVILDSSATPESIRASLKGTGAASFAVEERASTSSVFDIASAAPRQDFLGNRTLVWIDRVFPVKGVGTVALGFVLSGTVSVHDKLRPIPSQAGVTAEVKGIQINDQDFETAGRGIRVGLSLRGVEAKDLERSHWLDDGSVELAGKVRVQFTKSPFYKPEPVGRDLHLQLPGELVPARIEGGADGSITASLQTDVPVWEGMRVAVVDLNGKPLRIVGGGPCKL